MNVDPHAARDMIFIPEGTFQMGCPDEPNERPARYVSLSAFWIDKSPVTNREFNHFIDLGGYRDPEWWLPEGWANIQKHNITHPNYWYDSHFNSPECPVTGVSWWEAMAYAKFVGKALPTEAQWEYAAKGTSSRRFPWGDQDATPQLANYSPNYDTGERRTLPISVHPRNVSFFGCWDMAGNVAEWCLDNYAETYSKVEGWRDPLHLIDVRTPHVVRGGCWLYGEFYLRCTARDYYDPNLRDNLNGFRCVVNIATTNRRASTQNESHPVS